MKEPLGPKDVFTLVAVTIAFIVVLVVLGINWAL